MFVNLMRFARRAWMAVLCLTFIALGVIAIRMPQKTMEPLVAVQRAGATRQTHTAAPPPPVVGGVSAGDCGAPGDFAAAANDNAANISVMAVTPFGLPESGWATYAPLVAREIGTACAPQTAGFAYRLALWQSAHAVAAGGRLDAATLSKMSTIWLLRRPFVGASHKTCPPSPDEATLMQADTMEAYGGKKVLGRAGALTAYRQMVEAARRDLGQAVPQLRIASAYRGPIEEAVRCALGGCGTPAKARCSAHRTGLAFDFYLGVAPGSNAFSTDPANRLYLSQTPTYHWLVSNADRFGFVNYPYEPWHWEWTGEPI